MKEEAAVEEARRIINQCCDAISSANLAPHLMCGIIFSITSGFFRAMKKSKDKEMLDELEKLSLLLFNNVFSDLEIVKEALKKSGKDE